MPRNVYAGKLSMDRRSFVRRAGLLAAGSAFGSSFLGCDTIHVDIPCLSVAPAPRAEPE